MGSLRSPSRVDVAVAAVLAAYGLAEAAVAGAPATWFAGVIATTLPLAWRRRLPVEVIAWTLGMLLLSGAAGPDAPDTVLPLPLLVVCGFTAGREAPSGRLAAAGALAICAVVSIPFGFASGENSGAEDLVAVAVIVGSAAGAGHLMRVRHGETLRLQALTEQLAAEQEARAQAAVTEERARMARELHDIVAHSVSLIAVQAAAADELLDRDPARARASLESVQEAARGALGEMRRLLAVLRAGEAEPGREPQPGLRDLGALVEQAQASGLAVRLREEGARPSLSPGLDLSAYRIVQEALTNVRKHAAGAATEVRVAYGAEELQLEVVNELPPGAADNGSGHGILGMRERARIYGGWLDAGREDRRFVVRARLPLHGGEA